MKRLFDERLGRYQAAIALEPTDRVPIATGSNYFAEVYSGNTNQETIYDSEKWLHAELAFVRDFPEIDVMRNNRIWGPLFDAVGLKTYKLPGRDLHARDQFQFVEHEYMKADEYDLLIKNPVEFMFDRWLPRVLGELGEPGSVRSYMAFLKGGMAQMMTGQIMRNRAIRLQNELDMPQPMTGFFLAPFDPLADVMRGLTGAFMDCYRQPDKVIAACARPTPGCGSGFCNHIIFFVYFVCFVVKWIGRSTTWTSFHRHCGISTKRKSTNWSKKGSETE